MPYAYHSTQSPLVRTDSCSSEAVWLIDDHAHMQFNCQCLDKKFCVSEISHELELSTSTLYNPELMLKLSDVEVAIKETKAYFNTLQENEQGPDSTFTIKIECNDEENDQASHESENVLVVPETSFGHQTVVSGETSS